MKLKNYFYIPLTLLYLSCSNFKNPFSPEEIKNQLPSTTKQYDLALSIEAKIEPPYINSNIKLQNISSYDIIFDNLISYQDSNSILNLYMLNEEADTLESRITLTPFYLKLYKNGYMQVKNSNDTTKYSFSDAYIQTDSDRWGKKKGNFFAPLVLTAREINTSNRINNVDLVKYYLASVRYSKKDSLKEVIFVKEIVN